MERQLSNSRQSGFRDMRKRFMLLLRRQGRQIYLGGVKVFFRKVGILILLAPLFLITVIVRLLRPLILVRFGPLMSRRFGHLAIEPEIYLCEREAGIHGKRTWDIFYHTYPICNQQLKKMCDRILNISQFASRLDRINHWLPGYAAHLAPALTDRDIYGLLANSAIHFYFTPEEEYRGNIALRELGIPAGKQFVCFHSRESSYLESAFPGKRWEYHNFRNSKIENFFPLTEELVRRGYFAVRTGVAVAKPLQTTHPMAIDYAAKARNELLDIFLGAKCRFYIGDPCGFDSIPKVFRRPLVIVNMIPLEYAPSWGANYLFIPKKLWLSNERRFLTFREIITSGVGRFLVNEQYEQAGIEVIENTAEEITAAAVEMDERLKGKWQEAGEDKELQQQFWSLFKKSKLHGIILAHIGADFLRQNKDLLE